MKIWNFFKKLFGCKLDYIPKGTYNVSENKLFERDKDNINKIPDNEFICPICNFETVPEILGIKPYTGNLAIFCKNHDGVINISPTEYIDKLIEKNDDQNNRIRCLECLKSKENGKGTKNYYCIECELSLCEECYVKNKHNKHNDYLILNIEKKYRCKFHIKNIAKNYCIDCEEPICDDDKYYHPGHRIKDFESLQSKLNDHRKKIIKKMKELENLPSALKLYNLADKYGDDETKTKIKNSIEKETNKKIENFIEEVKEVNLDDNYVDLALYYLEKNGYKKEEKNEDKKEEKKEDNKKDKKKDKNEEKKKNKKDEKKKDKKEEKKKDKKDEKKKKKQKNKE